MDKRRKVLIVEDNGQFRNAVVRILKSADCRVRACGSLVEASAAISEMSFDLALVDIMLNGPVDMANRDGLQVLSRLKRAEEGTTVFVVSGQAHDRHLIRDVLKDYGADDYVFKQDIKRVFLVDLLQRTFASRPQRKKSWNALINVLAQGQDEASYVRHVLHTVQFKGGARHLQDRLLETSQWLMPLIPLAPGKSCLVAKVGGATSGVYWSKGQGCAAEMIIHGSNVQAEQLDLYLADRGGEALHDQTKGELRILVLARTDLPRSLFAVD